MTFDEIIQKLKGFIDDAKIPGFLDELKDDLLEDLEDAGTEVLALLSQGAIKADEVIPALKRRLLPKWSASLNNAWNAAPWYIQLLKPFIMRPVMKTLRGLLKKI